LTIQTANKALFIDLFPALAYLATKHSLSAAIEASTASKLARRLQVCGQTGWLSTNYNCVAEYTPTDRAFGQSLMARAAQ